MLQVANHCSLSALLQVIHQGDICGVQAEPTKPADAYVSAKAGRSLREKGNIVLSREESGLYISSSPQVEAERRAEAYQVSRGVGTHYEATRQQRDREGKVQA